MSEYHTCQVFHVPGLSHQRSIKGTTFWDSRMNTAEAGSLATRRRISQRVTFGKCLRGGDEDSAGTCVPLPSHYIVTGVHDLGLRKHVTHADR